MQSFVTAARAWGVVKIRCASCLAGNTRLNRNLNHMILQDICYA